MNDREFHLRLYKALAAACGTCLQHLGLVPSPKPRPSSCDLCQAWDDAAAERRAEEAQRHAEEKQRLAEQRAVAEAQRVAEEARRAAEDLVAQQRAQEKAEALAAFEKKWAADHQEGK